MMPGNGKQFSSVRTTAVGRGQCARLRSSGRPRGSGGHSGLIHNVGEATCESSPNLSRPRSLRTLGRTGPCSGGAEIIRRHVHYLGAEPQSTLAFQVIFAGPRCVPRRGAFPMVPASTLELRGDRLGCWLGLASVGDTHANADHRRSPHRRRRVRPRFRRGLRLRAAVYGFLPSPPSVPAAIGE